MKPSAQVSANQTQQSKCRSCRRRRRGRPGYMRHRSCHVSEGGGAADIREAPACARDYLVEDVGGGERHEGTEVGELRRRRSSSQSAQAGAMSKESKLRTRRTKVPNHVLIYSGRRLAHRFPFLRPFLLVFLDPSAVLTHRLSLSLSLSRSRSLSPEG